MKQYAIVIDDSHNLCFINLETFNIEYILETDYEIKDIAITKDQRKAYVTAFDTDFLLEINLRLKPPNIERIISLPQESGTIELSPNEKFILFTHDEPKNKEQIGVYINTNTKEALSIGSNSDLMIVESKIYKINNYLNRIKRMDITTEPEHTIVRTGQTALVKDPCSLARTSDNLFLFTVSTNNKFVEVLDISDERFFGTASKTTTKLKPYSLIVTKRNNLIYVLEDEYIEVFHLDIASKKLVLKNIMTHGLRDELLQGSHQMSLSPDEHQIVFSADDSVICYNIKSGIIKQLPIKSNGKIATYRSKGMYHHDYNLMMVCEHEIVMIDTQNLEEKHRVDIGPLNTMQSIAVTSDNSTAVITTLEKNILAFNLIKEIPELIDSIQSIYPVCSIVSHPNNQDFIMHCVNGIEDHNLYNYNLTNQALENIEVKWNNVTQSPTKPRKKILSQNLIHQIKSFFNKNNQDITSNWPSAIAFHPSGEYLFITFGQHGGYSGIAVIDTKNRDFVGLNCKITGTERAYTILVNKSGDTIYVLTAEHIIQYNFNVISERLIQSSSFEHNLSIEEKYGAPMMIFNNDETELLILNDHGLVKLSLIGENLGELKLTTQPKSLVLIPKV